MTEQNEVAVEPEEAPPLAPIEPPPERPTLNITTSPEVNKIAAALAKAQTGMKTVKPNKLNNFPVAKGGAPIPYADLAAYLAEGQPRLAAEGIAVLGSPATDVDTKEKIYLMRLIHKSGQWIQGATPLVVLSGQPGANPTQAVGSATTYARRYLFAGLVCMATEDDDGNTADGQPPAEEAPAPEPPQRRSREPASKDSKRGGGNSDSPPKLDVRPIDRTMNVPRDQWAGVGADWHTGRRISTKQQTRIYVAAREEGGWTNEQVKEAMIHHLGIVSMKEIPGDWEDRSLYPYGKLVEIFTTFSPEPDGPSFDENENQDAGQQPVEVR